jgi:hypothetical protein
MGLRIEYYRHLELVMAISTTETLVGAEKAAIAGLQQYEADRAKILGDAGAPLMVISAHRPGWEGPENNQ